MNNLIVKKHFFAVLATEDDASFGQVSEGFENPHDALISFCDAYKMSVSEFIKSNVYDVYSVTDYGCAANWEKIDVENVLDVFDIYANTIINGFAIDKFVKTVYSEESAYTELKNHNCYGFAKAQHDDVELRKNSYGHIFRYSNESDD